MAEARKGKGKVGGREKGRVREIGRGKRKME